MKNQMDLTAAMENRRSIRKLSKNPDFQWRIDLKARMHAKKFFYHRIMSDPIID